MKQSDAMALSIIVGIPGLAHTYMEPMKTDNSNLHASGLTYSPQGCCTSSSSQMLSPHKAISAQPLLGMKQSDAMALSIIVGIPDLAQIYMEPMETDSSSLHDSEDTYSPVRPFHPPPVRH